MGIAALTLDYNTGFTSLTGKDKSTGVHESSKSFETLLNEAGDKKCPYSFLAKDGIINYKSKPIEDVAKENETPDAEDQQEEKVIEDYFIASQENEYRHRYSRV